MTEGQAREHVWRVIQLARLAAEQRDAYIARLSPVERKAMQEDLLYAWLGRRHVKYQQHEMGSRHWQIYCRAWLEADKASPQSLSSSLGAGFQSVKIA